MFFKYFITDISHHLLQHSLFVQESLFKLKRICCDFLSYKKHFLHGIYEAWNSARLDIENFFISERLTAWHLVGHEQESKLPELFVSEFLNLQNILDTKPSKFIFRYK